MLTLDVYKEYIKDFDHSESLGTPPRQKKRTLELTICLSPDFAQRISWEVLLKHPRFTVASAGQRDGMTALHVAANGGGGMGSVVVGVERALEPSKQVTS